MICNPGPDILSDVDRLDEPPALSLLPRNGIYTIVVQLKEDEEIRVGSLGTITVGKGFYAYTGSAMGRGALSLRSRVLRHIKRDKKLRWHIDYLTSSRSSVVVGIVASLVDRKFECIVASTLNSLTRFVEGFGCSDCKCNSHLALLPFSSAHECIKFVEGTYRRLGLPPTSLILPFCQGT
ncbi:MAG: GIY-YIG nuclease family protein [Candidatus Nezhaarchaeales archaeon]